MKKTIRIFWAGDSTVQTNDITTYPQTGIGQVFSLYIEKDITICNHAKNGRSTKSFLDEGRLEPIAREIGEGDYLFIQFGHNDEKIQDPARYTEPFGTYKENLKLFIDTARSHGAKPVLITPLERRCFVDEKRLDAGAHGEYVAAMKETAEQENVPLVDLFSQSRKEMEKAGAEETLKWFMHLKPGEYASCPEGKEDNTHLKYEGAVKFAGLVAQGLKELGGEYKELLLPEIR
ncbi:MAG: rhamnogalacturonan acetylesterase [Lachnospiraceae bacterium]|nr:rhamnogalacturonan acetylesterase [Lachnospiraceae bacterium]